MKTFKSGSAFSEHLMRVAAEAAFVETVALDRGAALIQHAAKEEVGVYQRENTGPFAEWAELADRTKEDRINQGFRPNDPGYRTGDMQESIKREVAGREAVIGSDDQNLVWFEFGTVKQPPRSVLGLAAYREGAKAAAIIGGIVERFVAGLPLKNR